MPKLSIATWNVNSIKARTEHVKRWLTSAAPDVLCLQELKGLEFPALEFEPLGYVSATVTQKTYNGVAILSKHPLSVVMDKLPGDDGDEQARYLEVDVASIRLINIYLPNGNPVGSEKYPYKLKWMERLYARLKTLRDDRVAFVVCGDFNVIPDSRDCFDPALWAGDALFRLETRQAFRAILNLGLTDAFRAFSDEAAQYTFWDYQAGCWPKNKGVRIDHVLTSPPVTDRLKSCIIDAGPRGEDSPSDHTPVMIELR
jgi:exodeoxyribonuclease-3